MRTFLRGKITLLFMMLGMLIAIPAIAFADTITTDSDTVTADIQGSRDLGTVAAGTTVTPNPTVDFYLTCGGNNHLDNGQTDNITFASKGIVRTGGGAFSGGDASATASSVTAAAAWPDDGTNCTAAGNPAPVKGGSSTVTITAPSTPGTYTYTITYNNSVSAPAVAGNPSATFTLTVVSNQAPSVPGVPSGSSPNQGAFTLNWHLSNDDGNPAGSSVTYTLQHKDANDADFSNVASGISGASYTFGGTNAVEAEGTWTYRVSASDGSLSSAFSAASSAIKVDQSRPNAPLANVGTPDYTAPNGDKWFRNSATVSFTANGDPTLADGSTGSGVVSVSGDQSRDTTGALNYSGTATDDVGLVSLATSGTINVDATNPVANITCPSSSAILGSSASANWTASDVGSGLASPDSGSVDLTTGAIAANLTATAPTATDNVGLQSVAATCNYSVAAAFNGFLQPIDGNMVNQGKVGRVYPVKWQLRDSSGALLSDAAAQALIDQNLIKVQQRTMNCNTGEPTDTLETEVAAGSTVVRYDAASDQFVYNYKAPATKGCYNLEVINADGVNTKSIHFSFTK